MSEAPPPRQSHPPAKLAIKADDDTAKGRYANMAQVSSTHDSFVFDYAFVQGNSGWLLSRVILSPAHAKRFQRVLAETIAHHEERHGPVDEGTTLQ